MKTTRVWTKEEPFGTELAEITLGDNTLSAVGVAIGVFTTKGSEKSPYRADYRLTTVEHYVTSRLVLRVEGDGWRRNLDLRRLASGTWKCTTESQGELDLPPPGGDLTALQDAQDCDLAFSPLTNTMPILRHRGALRPGSDPVDVTAAWVSLPDLSIHLSRQRYALLRAEGATAVFRFEDRDDSFTGDITVDERGLVLDYPGIARSVL